MEEKRHQGWLEGSQQLLTQCYNKEGGKKEKHGNALFLQWKRRNKLTLEHTNKETHHQGWLEGSKKNLTRY